MHCSSSKTISEHGTSLSQAKLSAAPPGYICRIGPHCCRGAKIMKFSLKRSVMLREGIHCTPCFRIHYQLSYTSKNPPAMRCPAACYLRFVENEINNAGIILHVFLLTRKRNEFSLPLPVIIPSHRSTSISAPLQFGILTPFGRACCLRASRC